MRPAVVVFALLMVGLSGCKSAAETTAADSAEETAEEEMEMDMEEPVEELRYLALGDSYTIGESVDASARWPVQLAEKLRASGISVSEPEIIARTGWTTDELDAAITAAAPEGPYAMVSLLIGVNNQYRGRDVENFRGEFIALLDRAAGFAGGEHSKVLVVSIPDWGVTPFASGRDAAQIAAEIDAYNAVCAEESTSRGAHFVDITPYSREHGATQVAGDGLHPSGEMYAAWADMALPVAQAILSP